MKPNQQLILEDKVKKLKPNKTLDKNSSLGYRTSLVIWDQCYLPPDTSEHAHLNLYDLTPSSKLVLDLATPEG